MTLAPQKPMPVFPVKSLGEGFFDPVKAAIFPQTKIRYRNNNAAETIGLSSLSDDRWIDHFARFAPLDPCHEGPLAQRYHGHQFRHYNPEIGDGRGFLYAQFKDNHNRLIDLTTKGSGTTPYSRRGDGRLTLKGAFREILATEMLEALGVNTSKTLSVIETGEALHRGDEPSPTRSAVLVRQCHGSIRIGTFQRLAYFSDTVRLEKLVDYCLTHYFGGIKSADVSQKVLDLLDHVTSAAACNAADLMASGFVHGVLNSDNINITGEIFDFGPWRFLPQMDLAFTAAYFDETRLYSFGRQPEALHWNLYQLAGTLVELADEKSIREVLEAFGARYSDALKTRLLYRLGVKPTFNVDDTAFLALVNDFLSVEKVGYEQFFYDFYGGAKAYPLAIKQIAPAQNFAAGIYEKPEWSSLMDALKARDPVNPVARDHEYFRSGKACTLLIEEVEALWAPIAEQDDWSFFRKKLEDIAVMRSALTKF